MLLKKVQSQDFDLSKFQDNVDQAFSQLQRDNPILNGVFKTVTIATSDTSVDHGLGRSLTGYLVVGRNANATVYESSTSNPRPSDHVILKASTAVTAKLYFF